MNFCFSQNLDTLYYEKHFERGTVMIKDSTVGFMNSLFFQDKSTSEPITGIVIMNNKRNNYFYYETHNGIASKKIDTISNKLMIIEEFGNNKYSSSTYKNGMLSSIYNAEIVDQKIYFVKIKYKKEKYRIKQSYFDESGKLVNQTFTVKNLAVLYKLPLLLPL